MNRRVWLIATATLTACFVLYAPFCALACQTVADSPDTTQTIPPCHEPTPSSSSADPTGTPARCECEESSSIAILSGMPKTFALSASVAVLDPKLPTIAVAKRPARISRGHPEATDLPPPDILLLKSTLLI